MKHRILALMLALSLLLALTGCGGSSNKSYAEQYGYSVEDFYYKGSDGKWYSK